MWSIFKKEFHSYFNSITGYVIIGIFLLLSGFMFWLYPDSNIIDYGYADMSGFFQFCPYLFLFLVPAVCMKMFAEEFRSGTLELLYSKPLTDFQIIFGKFAASVCIILLAVLPTVVYFASLYFLGNPVGNIDIASVVASYIGLFFLISAFVAIGIFASSLSSNQIVAFLTAAFISYFFYDGLGQLASLFSGSLTYLVSYLGHASHYQSLSIGVLDSRDIGYFISFSLLFLYFTYLVLVKKRT